jgi:protocatechuate 4,5-dioxygenase beta chain
MATLIRSLCVTHNPLLARRFRQDVEEDPGIVEGKQRWEGFRREVADARPDVLLVVANDHLNQWFMDNMPAFMIGKAPTATGPFPHEVRTWGLDPYDGPGHPSVGAALLAYGLRAGVDFAFSDEYVLDHAFTVPLQFLRPEADIPVVPVFANVMALPMPAADRFYRVGEVLRDAIEELPTEQRVVAIFSGHLSVEVGGPRMAKMVTMGSLDPQFDRRMTALIATADIEALLQEATLDRMMEAGHVGGTGFLMYVLAVGMARGRIPTSADAVFSSSNNTMPFYFWNFEEGSNEPLRH